MWNNIIQDVSNNWDSYYDATTFSVGTACGTAFSLAATYYVGWAAHGKNEFIFGIFASAIGGSAISSGILLVTHPFSPIKNLVLISSGITIISTLFLVFAPFGPIPPQQRNSPPDAD